MRSTFANIMNLLLCAAAIVVLTCVSGCREADKADKAEVQPPSMESNLLLIEHMEFGIESFRVDSARCNLYKNENGIWEFVVDVSTNEAVKRSEKLKDVIHAKPNFEATAILPTDNLALVAGKIIVQKKGYDYSRDEHLSNIYYFNHNSIEDLRIEFIEVTDDWIDAQLTGQAIINGSNGNQPDAKISLRAKFKRDKELKRGIS